LILPIWNRLRWFNIGSVYHLFWATAESDRGTVLRRSSMFRSIW